MIKRWVVRIVTAGVGAFDRQVEDGPLLECLRYAGLVQVHRSDAGTCFDLFPPGGKKGQESKIWAEQNAARLQSFRVNAVCAPEFPVPDQVL